MSDIATRVKKIIVDKLGVEEAEVTNEASFTNDLGADSLDTVELIMEFEKEFNISIPDEQAETIEPRQMRQHGVVLDALVEQQSLRLAVFGHHHDACVLGGARMCRRRGV